MYADNNLYEIVTHCVLLAFFFLTISRDNWIGTRDPSVKVIAAHAKFNTINIKQIITANFIETGFTCSRKLKGKR